MDTPEASSLPVPEIALPYHLAVQVQRWENHIVAVEAFCATAKALGALFRRVETFGIIHVGMRPFLRMRTDLDPIRVKEVLQQLVKATSRGAVYALESGRYEVQFPPHEHGGRTGVVPSFYMYAKTEAPATLYRGPKIKKWEKQFPPQGG